MQLERPKKSASYLKYMERLDRNLQPRDFMKERRNILLGITAIALISCVALYYGLSFIQ